MKNPTHITVGRLSALAVSLVLFALLLISKLFLAVDLNWLIIIVIPLLLLLASSLIIAYAINYFIYRKIKVIYKNIYETKKSQPDKSNFKKMHGDILAEVSGEVVEWGKNKKKEQKKMRKMGSYRKEFLANVFHELKTPVFNIQGYIETLLEGGLDDKEVNKKFLHKANENVERITNIVDDLQLITNLEEGSFILRLEKFDITKLVWEVLDSLDIIAGTKHITLEVKEGCNKSFFVMAERELIGQVLDNLVTNSIKYGKEGGRTQVGFYEMGDNILVDVTDNGIGIDQVHLPRIFERFYRVDKDRSRQQGGSGLGLSIVKHIIERHGMTVNVRSTLEIGSTFGFTLSKT